MARRVGRELPEALQAWLASDVGTGGAGLALVLVTTDEAGQAHPAMLSVFEVVPTGPSTLRLATYDTSRTAANLRDRSLVTVVAVVPGAAYYLKGRARPSAVALPGHACFDVDLDDVSLDEADTAREGHARIVSGIQFAGDDVYLRRARALNAALRGS